MKKPARLSQPQVEQQEPSTRTTPATHRPLSRTGTSKTQKAIFPRSLESSSLLLLCADILTFFLSRMGVIGVHEWSYRIKVYLMYTRFHSRLIVSILIDRDDLCRNVRFCIRVDQSLWTTDFSVEDSHLFLWLRKTMTSHKHMKIERFM